MKKKLQTLQMRVGKFENIYIITTSAEIQRWASFDQEDLVGTQERRILTH